MEIIHNKYVGGKSIMEDDKDIISSGIASGLNRLADFIVKSPNYKYNKILNKFKVILENRETMEKLSIIQN